MVWFLVLFSQPFLVLMLRRFVTKRNVLPDAAALVFRAI
jgi:hypothetical protein